LKIISKKFGGLIIFLYLCIRKQKEMKNLLIIIATILSFTASAQTASEKEMFNLVNQVRTNPKSFIPVIEAYIADMSKPKKVGSLTVTKKVDPSVIAELKSLISFLNTVKPVDSLVFSQNTYIITKLQATFMDSTKQVTHNSFNGDSYAKRIKPLGLTGGENCTTGADAKTAMILLLLDYKATEKGHRNNIFNPTYTKLSVGNSGAYWVQDFIN
jgi:uncharacterized protein YkwD